MATAWDIDTAVYEEKYASVGSQDGNPQNISFKPDGLKMYVLGKNSKKVFQYSLSEAWEVDSAVYDDKFINISGQVRDSRGFFFKPDDGLKMYVVCITNDTVYQYLLSTPWEIDTAVYEEKFKYVGDEDGVPYSVRFKPDGQKMYMVGGINDKVYQYDLPVGEIFYQSVSGDLTSSGIVVKLPKKTLSGTLTFIGSLTKGLFESLSGTITFVGSLITLIRRLFRQSEISIVANQSVLSIASNGSNLSISVNQSVLDIDANQSVLSIKG